MVSGKGPAQGLASRSGRLVAKCLMCKGDDLGFHGAPGGVILSNHISELQFIVQKTGCGVQLERGLWLKDFWGMELFNFMTWEVVITGIHFIIMY